MLLGVSNTQLYVQGVEYIGELRHCLVPFLPQCGPSRVLIIIASDRVILLLKSTTKDSQVGMVENMLGSSVEVFSQWVSHQMFTWGRALRREKVIFSLSKKL